MQAALRKPRPVWFWMDLEAVINKVMHKKREQLWSLHLCGLGAYANNVPIAQIDRSIKIELRELLGDHGLPPRLQSKNSIIY